MKKFLTLLFLTSLFSCLRGQTFCVDVSGISGITDVGIFGTFNGWMIGANSLTDPDGDGIWCGSVSIPADTGAGEGEYKFVTNVSVENFSEGEPCTATTIGEAGEVFTNRVFTGGDPGIVCFNSCTACPDDTDGGDTDGGDTDGGDDGGDTDGGDSGSELGLNGLDLSDPCRCGKPENIETADGFTSHFFDILAVRGAAPSSPVFLTNNGGGTFLNAGLSSVPTGQIFAPDGTPVMTDATGSVDIPFFVASGTAGTIEVQVAGAMETQAIGGCDGNDCVTIPTMSEWGLMIFLLLIMNLSLVFLKRLEFAGLRMS